MGAHGPGRQAQVGRPLTAGRTRRVRLAGRRPPSPDDPDLGYYGRLQGRPLRPYRQKLLAELLPRVALAVPDPPVPDAIDPAVLFPAARDVWVEVGFGAGEHLVWQVEHNPGVGLIGCEMFVNGVASLLRHIEERRLTNVRVVTTDARGLLRSLPDASVGRVFVLFPDPWPKARHFKRRMIAPASLHQIARVLKDGGTLRFASDHAGYCRWTLGHALAQPGLAWTAERPADWLSRGADWPETRYEQRAAAAGRTSLFFTFVRTARASH